MKKRLVLAALLALLTGAHAHAYEAGKTYSFTILHTNETHGRFWHNEQGEYGFAAQKTLVDRGLGSKRIKEGHR